MRVLAKAKKDWIPTKRDSTKAKKVHLMIRVMGDARGVYLLLLCCVIFLAPTKSASAAPLPNFDKRRGGSQNEPLTRQTVHAEEKDFQVSFDPITGSPRLIRSRSGLIDVTNNQQLHAQAQKQEQPQQVVERFIGAHTNLFGRGSELLNNLSIKRVYTTPHNGMRTVHWQQSFHEIPVFGGLMTAELDRGGRLISLSSRLVRDPGAAAERGTPDFRAHIKAPPIDAATALQIAATNLGALAMPKSFLPTPSKFSEAQKTQVFRSPSLKGEARAKLVWLPIDRNTARLCWQTDLRIAE